MTAQSQEELLAARLEQQKLECEEPIIEDEEDDDDDDDAEEGQDEYEKDGFIVDDVEEEEDEDEDEDEDDRADSDDERQKKKKRKKRESERNYVLDEDDYELLQESNIAVPRPKLESKKFKRLKKAQRIMEDEGSGFYEEEFDETGRRGRTAEQKLECSLFGDDEGPQLEDIAEEEERLEEEEDADIGEEDEMADFIVDEEEVDEHGAPIRRKKVNKKKSRQAPGVSSSALQEAHDIFGDVDELLMRRKQDRAKSAMHDESGELSERRLEDEFDPTILAEKYMTEKDEHIRKIDIPERMQISEESTGPVPPETISVEESNWIYNQLAAGVLPLFKKKDSGTTDEENELPIDKDDIMRFLDLMHVQKFDVPFIAMYRKEECMSLFKDPEEDGTSDDGTNESDKKPAVKWHKVLWAIQDLDRKWLLLQKRKSALELYYKKRFQEESRRVYDETRLKLNQQLFESISKSLQASEFEREVDDVDSKFNLHFPPGEVGVDEGQYRRPKRKSQYSICSKSGLWDVASKLGFNAEQFGRFLSLEKMGDELEDAREPPEEMASNFTCAMFETPQAVLKGARHMAAAEVSCEPSVRKHVRSTYMAHAVVSTSPTPDGNVVIDSFHQFSGVKWLRDKPLSKFEDAQWLLIQKAEEEKLLQVTIKLPEVHLNHLMTESRDHYLSDGVSKSAQLWNEQRKLILEDAIFNFLLPSMEKEARSLLTSKSKNYLLMEYGNVLWNKVSVGPYQRRENDHGSDEEPAPRVMACCWGPGKPATTFVMLDSSGEVLDILYAGSLSLRGQNVDDEQRKKNDQQRLLKFMMDHQPHVVVLGAVNLSCTRLKEDIYEIIFKMVEDNPRDVGHEMDNLNIIYGDESLPHLYENSRISADQLPTQSGIVKRAVALGRYLQNPLAMVATLCGPGREILSWKLNTLESLLTPDEKYEVVEQVMVDVTNQVGVDLNLAISHEWLFAPLQFISGLGPRKAASLQRSLVRQQTIFTRKDLLTEHHLGKKVFVNAVGFLRVRRSGYTANSNTYIDLLDDTRIHPESYSLAQELAKDIYLKDMGEEDNDDDEVLEMAIEHVKEKPHLLRSVNAYEYAKTKNRLNKRETLNCIKLELMQGFEDWRRQYVEPSQDEEFYMISGESEETLSEGRTVQATVRRVQPQKAICALECGLTGILMKEDSSDDWRDVNDLTEKMREGDILTCRIKSIQKNRYQVFLSCKENDMRNNRYQSNQNLDPYYHEDRSSLQSEKEKARKEKELAKKHFKPRMIVHPRFQNITTDEAMEFLSDKEPGESVVRPSSRGLSHLTLTLKVYDGVYVHKDIVEGGKEHKDITSLLRIGKTLKIGEDTFEDLDEVMDRYVDPLVTHLKAMLNYRKYKMGTKAEVDELLKIEKSENPMRIFYSFGISHEHPGTFILTYIRSSDPHHEYVGLNPKGFKFRKRMFEEIDRLVAYFQRHINDPHDSGPSIRSVSAIVPMRSPASGCCSGFGGGWSGSSKDSGRRGGQSGDTKRSSGSGSRPGRNDYRNRNNDDQSGLPPRPYGGRGRGRGRGRGSSNNDNDGQDSNYGSQKWSSKGNGGGWGEVQNSPARESWGGGGESGSGDGGGWGASPSGDGSWGGSGDTGGNSWGKTPVVSPMILAGVTVRSLVAAEGGENYL